MSFRSRILGGALGLALVASLAAAPVRAQECLITGPSTMCPGEWVELCAPMWADYIYEWTAPDGSQQFNQCVITNMPGAWTLRIVDPFHGTTFGPCTHNLSVTGGGAECLIAGPTTGCEGTTVTLCGPEGAASWYWTGPMGYLSSERCVTVSTSGVYEVGVPGGTGNCVGGEELFCSQQVTFAPCGGTVQNCPRPTVFWSKPCRSGDDDDDDDGDDDRDRDRAAASTRATDDDDDDDDDRDYPRSRLTREQLALVAASVDEHVVLFEWEDDTQGFCSTVRPRHSNLRTKAKKQFASVWANVCAAEVGITPSYGPSVGLDPSALFVLDGARTTVGGWLSMAEAELASLEGASLRTRSVKNAYKAIIRSGWHINHGQGVEPACGFTSGKGGRARLDDAVYLEDLAGDESLDEAMLDDSEAPMAMELTGPNPFTANSSVAFTLGSTDARDVRVGVYDIAGRLVRELARGSFEPGRHEIRWDGRDRDGVRARGGMYFVIGRVGDDRVDARLTLIR